MAGVAILGVTGRMGQCLLRALAEQADVAAAEASDQRRPAALSLSGALASSTSARLGEDAAESPPLCGVRITADPSRALAGAAVAIDFSRAQALPEHLAACVAAQVPVLIGTTGFDEPARAAVEAAAAHIAVLVAPNTSLGVAVLARLVALATRALGPQADIEISEVHHRGKLDAPSGTALALGEVIAQARAGVLETLAVRDRAARRGPREPSSIGFSSQRAGDIVGEHTVLLALAGERLELTHRALDRMIFARGALAGARWLLGRTAGRYSMADVLAP